jgi:hypothetical protein
MLSDEERKAIDKINNSYDYNTGWMEADASDWRIVTDLIEKQQKEIEDLENRNEKLYEDNLTLAQELKEVISVDKIKTILGIEEDIDNEKLLSLLQTIVDENARLEDIEDRKVQIEYNNVFNKGVKSVEYKIKAKIEEYEKQEKDEPDAFICKRVLQSLLEKE